MNYIPNHNHINTVFEPTIHCSLKYSSHKSTSIISKDKVFYVYTYDEVTWIDKKRSSIHNTTHYFQ